MSFFKVEKISRHFFLISYNFYDGSSSKVIEEIKTIRLKWYTDEGLPIKMLVIGNHQNEEEEELHEKIAEN